jgi:hypothetical protein
LIPVTVEEAGTNATGSDFCSDMRVSEYFKSFRRNLLAKTEFNGYNIAMKSKYSFARNVLLMFAFGCVTFVSTVALGESRSGYLRSNHHYPPGRLVVDRVPNFGWNIGFNLQIDGMPAGSIVQGHSYSTLLPPGPHVLTVQRVPATGYTAPTSTTVNIQPGTDHLYVALWDSGLVYLHPVGVSVTPGAYWQLHGDGAP